MQRLRTTSPVVGSLPAIRELPSSADRSRGPNSTTRCAKHGVAALIGLFFLGAIVLQPRWN